jgi:DNA polymerase-4
LRARFGVWADELKARARGEDDRPVVPYNEPKSISNETTFERDVRDRTQLERTLWELAEEVAQRLRAEGVRGRTVQLKLRWSDFTTLTRRATLAEPTDDTGRLAQTALRLLRRELAAERPVRLIGVGAQNLERGPAQLDLFDPQAARKAQLERAADAVKAKFGNGKLKRGGAV